MYNDELIWQVINHGHCAYKTKARRAPRALPDQASPRPPLAAAARRVSAKSTFCRNKYNYNGLCNRSSCPLANSQYATVLEDKGRAYLCMKTVERAHLPKQLWERIRLSRNYTKALKQLDKHLEFWPKLMVRLASARQRNKQRLTKIHQFLLRVRRIDANPVEATRAIREKNGLKRALVSREAKALKAADLGTSIEKELLARLKSGTYGDIYNFPEAQYEKALDKAEKEFEYEDEEEAAEPSEYVAGEEDSDDEEADSDDDDDDDDSDDDSDGDGPMGFGDDLEDIGQAFAAGGLGDDDDEDSEDDDEDDDDDDASGPAAAAAASAAAPAPGRSAKRARSTDGVEMPGKRGRGAAGDARGPRVEVEYEGESGARETASERAVTD
ncbi:mak16-a, partial [Symbiodinium sp. KB8]